MVAETLVPGVMVNEVARLHGVKASFARRSSSAVAFTFGASATIFSFPNTPISASIVECSTSSVVKYLIFLDETCQPQCFWFDAYLENHSNFFRS